MHLKAKYAKICIMTKKEETYEEIVKDIHDIQDRIESKMDSFQEFLKQKDLEFKLMELEEKALKINPDLKNKIQ